MSKKTKKTTIDESVTEEQDTTVVTDENTEEQAVEQTREEKLEEELQIEKDKFLRLFAEFENYKKRTSKERIDLFKTAGEDVMLALLPVLDDFERALSHIEDDKEAEDLRKGVLLIYNKLLTALEQKGLKAITIEKGDDFNPDNHEAITQIPAPNDKLKGKIIDVVEKGYVLGDKVIRFPKVVIGQ
ncbi:MAG: nucleotide exchange factor GrpE [Bacteroidia bacterium]|nr:nucleotide exchange factor GrpE [Bacteroidia bacterium]NND25307.1 nucleotide exchange factor GrpE [Flavobacteriaceae bacterium]MBT8279607.1 nucleotide exchange factor GrpE [Bacteroidia bacterium]NNK59293.1 nucleotide exchange factor GrpE [Flavobacteriaceae bacterium]NNL34028.1 nucleotide exchange factor GrpE [Flavobacteriaceae bacterium]